MIGVPDDTAPGDDSARCARYLITAAVLRARQVPRGRDYPKRSVPRARLRVLEPWAASLGRVVGGGAAYPRGQPARVKSTCRAELPDRPAARANLLSLGSTPRCAPRSADLVISLRRPESSTRRSRLGTAGLCRLAACFFPRVMATLATFPRNRPRLLTSSAVRP